MFCKPAKVTKPDNQETEAPAKISLMLLRDEELVARAQKDDQRAIEELICRYQQKAYAIAYHMCFGDHETAEDLTQEAFLRVFRNIKKFRGKASFYTWFYRVVVNTCIDGIRRLRRREKIFSVWGSRGNRSESAKEMIEKQPDMADGSNPSKVLNGKQLSQEVREALMSLSEKQRVVFQLKVFQEKSIVEIAQLMKVAEGTVKSHLFRATHALREALKDWAEP